MKHEKHQWGIFYLRKVVIYLDLDFFYPTPLFYLPTYQNIRQTCPVGCCWPPALVVWEC